MALVISLQAVSVLLLAGLGLLLWRLYTPLMHLLCSPLLSLPGPPSPDLLFGNLRQIFNSEGKSIGNDWIEKYGHSIVYRAFLNTPRLYTVDPRALNHILTHSADYQKPAHHRKSLAELLGAGVLSMEGDQHRQQRRVMNPAFGPSQIRDLTDIFVSKSTELRDVWAGVISLNGQTARIDVLKDLSKATLDIIGLAGFNYAFNSLNPNGKPNELAKAFEEVLDVPNKMPIFLTLRNFFPILRHIPNKRVRRMEEAQTVMRRIGSQLIAEKKAAIVRESAELKNTVSEKNGSGRRDLRSRDLLTLLIKANMATDIPESQRLSDEDVLAQVPTFLVAGHETTSTATTWCLFSLAQTPRVQRKLRDELLTIDTDTPDMDQLMSLPYLDMVVRETLRLHPPVVTSIRVATKHDVIPLSQPLTDRYGNVQDHIKVTPGSRLVIPIATMNRLKSMWGQDSHEFKPERWESPPEATSHIPGVWGHLLTFLGGPRACIGFRFSLVEMKALLFTLIRAFEFELAVPASEITKRTTIVQRPVLRSAPEMGSQMPLIVKPYHSALLDA